MSTSKSKDHNRKSFRQKVIRIAREIIELPGFSSIGKPVYRRYFRRPYRHGNIYHGVFDNHEQALKSAHNLSTARLPSSYDVEQAPDLYLDQLHRIRSCDYPAMFWVGELLKNNVRRVFDLGGHLGLAYFGFGRYLHYPATLDWCVHDLPQVVSAGRELAGQRDTRGCLRFSPTLEAMEGADLLISTGALQYLPRRLPEYLRDLEEPPRHVLINLTPMHPERLFFTVQNLGIALCPYRIESIAQLVAEMESLGYSVRDSWQEQQRSVRIPFHQDHAVDAYWGFYFRRITRDVPRTSPVPAR